MQQSDSKVTIPTKHYKDKHVGPAAKQLVSLCSCLRYWMLGLAL